MPTISLASSLARWVPAGTVVPTAVAGATVREALAELFAACPTLRGYVLDERGEVRHHVVVYVGCEAIRDKVDLDSPVAPDAEIHIFQALSGG